MAECNEMSEMRRTIEELWLYTTQSERFVRESDCPQEIERMVDTFCDRLECMYHDCKNVRLTSESCRYHCCDVEGCERVGCSVDDGRVYERFCRYHVCSKPGCYERMVNENNGMCEEHSCCVEGCDEEVDIRMKFGDWCCYEDYCYRHLVELEKRKDAEVSSCQECHGEVVGADHVDSVRKEDKE